MNLFGFKARRAAAGPVLSRGRYAVGPVSAGLRQEAVPRDYSAQVSAAYLSNAVAQRAVRLVAEAVGSAPLLAGEPGITALLTARSGGQALLETCAAQLLLHGNAYVQILADGAGRPAELFALRPDRVSIELDARGWAAGFTYRAGGQVTHLPAEDSEGRIGVVQIKTLHPLDDHLGLGALNAAAVPVAIHNAAARWNQALLDNAARPSGALVYDTGEPGASLSPAQFERLQAEMAAQFQGAGNAGRPMLLDGGLKWQAMSLTPADMDFIRLKDSAAREIAMAFGVPPMLLGLPGDATYANYREAGRALWRLTVLPLAMTLLAGIDQALASWGVERGLSIDLDRVPALAEDRERLWTQVSAADFLTDDEKRAMLGLGAMSHE